ncbi:MAG: MFS transporter [Candidatus Omnitrophica bacterium]|nr:MFS transporter [Candidatus Omnitrophota bacterium]
MEKENKRTLKVFAWASFLNDMGSDMIYPVWPLFVTTVLNANMAVLGLIDGLGEALVSISQAVSGYVSDKTKKRKVFIWAGYLCAMVSRTGYALSAVWQQLIFFKVLDRAGKMRGAPRDAIIADISTREDRGGNFGLLRMMDNLGAVCGILLCILLFKFIGYRNLFLLAAIPSLISVLLVLFLVKEKKAGGIKLFKGLSPKNLSWNCKLFFLLSAVFALGNFTYSFLLVYAKKLGFAADFMPVLYFIFTAAALIFSLPFGKLADKIGRKPLISLSFAFWALVVLSFIAQSGRWTIILAFVLYGMHKGALEPVQRTLVSELAPMEHRASAIGLFQMVIGLCALPASLVAGMLWDKMGRLIPFYLSLGLTVAAVIMLIFVKEPKTDTL